LADTTRDKLAAQLEERMPAEWVIVPFARNLDRPSKTTVMLHATEVRPSTAAQGVVEVDFVVTVISPKTDVTNAQDDLDDQVLDLILTLRDSAPGLVFRSASPTLVQDVLAWDINTTIHARKDA
jgi:hypothetical protein